MKKLKCPKIWISKYRMLFLINLLSWLITTIGDMVDMIISGYFIGDNAVSAVEIVTPMGTFLLFVSTFIFIGTSTLFARKSGEFHESEAYEIAGTGLITSIVTGIILTILLVIFQKTFLGFYASDTSIDALALDYYRCYIPVALIYPVYWLIYYLVTIDGDMVTVFISDIVNVAANLIFSIILVKIFGIKGIGYGTLIGIILSGLVLLFHFEKKINTIHFTFKMRFKSLLESFKISSSTAFLVLYISITDIVMNKLVLVEFGEKYLSIYGVINLILNLAVCLVCAVSAAVPFICVSYGEKNYLEVINVMRKTTKYTFVLNIIFTLVIETISTIIPSLFGISDAKMISDTILAVRILGLSYLISGFLSEFSDYYSKIEHTLLANILAALHMLIGPMAIVIPMTIIFGFNGMIWGFFSVPIVTIIIGCLLIRIKYGKKAIPYIIDENTKKIKIINLDIKNSKIKDLNMQINSFLKENEISDELNKQIQKCSKDFYKKLKKYDNQKKFLLECTIMIKEQEICMIFKDNGKIRKNEEKIENCEKHLYSVTTGFNRNSFVWEMN